jgi:CCR4-NOT transcription complex subunit 6
MDENNSSSSVVAPNVSNGNSDMTLDNKTSSVIKERPLSSVERSLERGLANGATFTPSNPTRYSRSKTVGGIPSSKGKTNSRAFTLRIEQPVESVELDARSYLRDVGVIDETNATWEWSRSVESFGCSNEKCTSKAQGKQARYESVCFESSERFCSTKCLKECWAKMKERSPYRKANLNISKDEIYNALNGEPDHLKNYRSDTTWETVAYTKDHVPTNEDVDHLLRVQVHEPTTGASATRISKMVLPFPEMPPPRQVIYAQAQHHVTNDRVRVVTYNLLAAIYATQTMFPYCPMWALSWNFRKDMILRELMGYDADVLCMQEVQADHFENFLYPQLHQLGYEGLYKQKTREAFGPAGRVDGCATFYKRSKFQLRVNNVIEFNEAALKMAKEDRFAQTVPLEGSNDTSIKRLLRDNVAQICVLEMLGSYNVPVQICISNVHIYWDPQYADVKLWQAHILIKELQNFITTNDIPLILMGDFNSSPDSSVYNLLAHANVSRHHEDVSKDKLGILPPTSKLTHNLALQSVCTHTFSQPPIFLNPFLLYTFILT